LLREFTVEQLIYLVNKVNRVTKSIYEGGLSPGVSKKGYQATFQEYVKIVKEASSRMPKGGPIDVDLSSPAVYQLWDNVRYVMNMASAKMHPFLILSGVVDGNVLTPFAASIDTTEELLEMVKDYFKPPKRDLRGLNDRDEANAAEDVEYMSEDDEINQCVNASGDEMSPDVMEAFMKDIAEAEAMCHDSNSFVSTELVPYISE
jgi:hypothetical protein